MVVAVQRGLTWNLTLSDVFIPRSTLRPQGAGDAGGRDGSGLRRANRVDNRPRTAISRSTGGQGRERPLRRLLGARTKAFRGSVSMSSTGRTTRSSKQRRPLAEPHHAGAARPLARPSRAPRSGRPSAGGIMRRPLGSGNKQAPGAARTTVTALEKARWLASTSRMLP